MKHDLWKENEYEQTFCLSGPDGDQARALLSKSAKLIWTCEASSYFEAMQKYYKFMDWGEYKTDYPEHDKKTYKELGIES